MAVDIPATELIALAYQAADAVERDIAAGEAPAPAWQTALDDAWHATAVWSRAAAPDLVAATATTASILMRAADILWARYLVNWCDENVLPRLEGPQIDMYSYCADTCVRFAAEGGGATDALLEPLADLAGVTLPTRH